MISRLANGACIGLLSLLASAPTTPPQQQEPTPPQHVASFKAPSWTNRIEDDLESAINLPLEFIRSLDEQYSPKEVKELTEEELKGEANYAVRLSLNIPNAGVRFLTLHRINEGLEHRLILQETLGFARDGNSSFTERKNAIEHAGLLSNYVKKEDLDSIAETLAFVLREDLERLRGEDVTSETLPSYLTIQAYNTAQRFLQIHPKGESSARLVATMFEHGTDPSANFHATTHSAFALDATYSATSPNGLKGKLARVAKRLPLEERRHFSKLLKEGDRFERLFLYLGPDPETGYTEPKFVYSPADHLGELRKRFEKVFGSKNPKINVDGSRDYREVTEEFLEDLRINHPAEWFCTLLVARSIGPVNGGGAATHYNSRIDLPFSRFDRSVYTPEQVLTGLRSITLHERGHLLHGILGLNLGQPSHLAEEKTGEWGYMAQIHSGKLRNMDLSESAEISLKAKNWHDRR